MMSSILWAIAGGGLIGLAASWLLLSTGRVAGVSGIVGGLLGGWNNQSAWRASFLLGLLAGGATLVSAWPESIVAPAGRALIAIAVAGALVGYGTRLGSGCTSGHAVCGLTRFSPRSLVATLVFMGTGVVTATIFGLVGGGS